MYCQVWRRWEDEDLLAPYRGGFISFPLCSTKLSTDHSLKEKLRLSISTILSTPRFFDLVPGWMYTQKIILDPYPKSTSSEHSQQSQLIQLWVLADRLLIPKLQNAVPKELQSTKLLDQWYLAMNGINWVYSNTAPESKLRLMIAAPSASMLSVRVFKALWPKACLNPRLARISCHIYIEMHYACGPLVSLCHPTGRDLRCRKEHDGFQWAETWRLSTYQLPVCEYFECDIGSWLTTHENSKHQVFQSTHICKKCSFYPSKPLWWCEAMSWHQQAQKLDCNRYFHTSM